MSSDSAVLVCTPEIVKSWIFYPAWFCLRNLLPRHLVMDYADYARAEREATSIDATPYDYIVWDTLQKYERFGLLIARVPMYERRGFDNPTMFDYRYYVPESKRAHFRTDARRIIKGLSREQLEKITLNGFRSWLRFGLQLKKKFKTHDTVFVKAIDITTREIGEIERGNIKIDPEKLLYRYFMKLFVGLAAADQYTEMAHLPTRVFDTPEYLDAARLLSKKLGVPFERFAIPDQGPDANERVIMNILGLDEKESISPLCMRDFELLLEAVKYLDSRIEHGKDKVAAKTVEAEMAKKYKEANHALNQMNGLTFAGGMIAQGPLIHAFMKQPGSELVPLVFSLLATVVALVKGEDMLRDTLRDFPPPVKFVVVREHLYGPIFRGKRFIMEKLLALARTVKKRPESDEEIARQMMVPWLKHDVWYE